MQLIRLIESKAEQQPAIGSVIENDVFVLNTKADAQYGVFCVTQGQHSGSLASDLATYSLTLYYIDRLTADQSNAAHIQSVGHDVLMNILRLVADEGVYVGSWSAQPFTQRFADECAGVFINVSFSVPFGDACGYLPEDD